MTTTTKSRTGRVYSWLLAVLALTAAAQGTSQAAAQQAFVMNTAPAMMEMFAPPPPPPVVDGAYMRSQLRNPRVVDAWVAKRFELIDLFYSRGVSYPAAELYLRIFKRERVVELWARSPGGEQFTLIKEYAICALSDIGPKLRQGDGMTPEGFYTVDFLNPQSEYHLSMHVDYPNAVDAAQGRSGSLGGDIFIHGGCLTEGCIAVTDESIKELYWLAVEAKAVGQERIPVHIFPTKMGDRQFAQLTRVFRHDTRLLDFWKQLKAGYDHFERTQLLPDMQIRGGRYELAGTLATTVTNVDARRMQDSLIVARRTARANGAGSASGTVSIGRLRSGPARSGPSLLGDPAVRSRSAEAEVRAGGGGQ